MCGIVGYTGQNSANEFLIHGLSRLEYRGYDSAGVSVIDSTGHIVTAKAVGKVINLKDKSQYLGGNIGIGHTRWATHGEPSERNAHPHMDNSGRFAIVHNGIIENYQELRRNLESKNLTFNSDTDSEVIVHLISESYDGDLVKALCATLKKLNGTYAIALISSLHPDTIICARKGSPLIVGVGKNANMIASDATAFHCENTRVLYLEDGEVAVVTPNDVELQTIDNIPVERELAKIPPNSIASDKGIYEHYMLKEIHEQPEAISNTIGGRFDVANATALLSGLNLSPRELSQINRIVIAACGSSLHAGLIGEYFLEEFASIPTEVAQAAEFRYRNPILEPNTLVIAISQSGETADTLAAVREALSKGAIVAAITNVVGSTIAREAGRGIYLHAGVEISVASTKAFSCQVAALGMLALLLGRNRRMSYDGGKSFIKSWQGLPAAIELVLAESDRIEAIAKKYAHLQDFFFIGRGSLFPVALEGALKLKEISYVHAEGYHAAELKHGPIALLDEHVPVIALANDIAGRDKMLGNIQECKARKSPVIAVVTGQDNEVEEMADAVISLPETDATLAPLTTVTALQLFAYFFAKERNCEIDQPKNLAKSVTVE